MSRNLHYSLLRPSVIHILRAAGYHSARPSVVDTLTDIAARFMLLLASTSASHSLNNHDDTALTVTDVRMAFRDCGLLFPTLTASEEYWRESSRKEIEDFPERNGLRSKEQARRDASDTQDIRDFIEWFNGDRYREIIKVASSTGEKSLNMESVLTTEDFVTVLKKKHSKTGEESRYQGSVLGKSSDNRLLKIEGGPAGTLREWQDLISLRNSSIHNSEEEMNAKESQTSSRPELDSRETK